ncbi:MAG: hypothetical protein K2L16_01040 [Muribaculaceae bacterium]|nr:hypothetical protein [Muribaculaceae bacterium]
MKFKSGIYVALLAVLLVLGLGSCRSHRNVAGSQPENEVCEELPWQSVEMPVRLELTAPTHFSASGKAVMVNGEYVSVSIRKMGFEVASLYVDSDSLYVIIKPLRLAYVEGFDRIERATDMSFGDLQKAMLGQGRLPDGLVRFVVSNMEQSPAGTVYSDIEVSTRVSGRDLNGKLHWSLDDARWNTGASRERPSIPNSYDRVDTPALIRMLRSLSL